MSLKQFSDFMLNITNAYILDKLRIIDSRKVEIELKKKLLEKEYYDIIKLFQKKKKIRLIKTNIFIDQFLDTRDFRVFHSGASLRLRYKGNGKNVYLQYKGPGFLLKNILFRSEFSSKKIDSLVKEEGHSDIIKFTEKSFMWILNNAVDDDMRRAMYEHLGSKVIRNIQIGPVICFYKKIKYEYDINEDIYLEPSLDFLSAFHINNNSFHPMSSFYEYENEIKSRKNSLLLKLKSIEHILEFEEEVHKKVRANYELTDKYHRIMKYFVRRNR
ncbi:MAG: CYTH domain-containing protein [Deltaproteobacteria bacterium]|nr:CYTH domain-containing protein [Deltaproteobacteria bacterium]